MRLQFIVILFLFVGSCGLKQPSLEVVSLAVEGRENFPGIEEKQPLLSWKIRSSSRATEQTAYQVLVSSSGEKLADNQADLWDSGKINSDSSIHVAYEGVALESYQRCYWKVRVWTNHGDSVWSAVNHWQMAMLHPEDWKAQWIGLDTFSAGDRPYDQDTRLAARYLRKEATIEKEIQAATAYISGLGLYECYINGEKVGNDVLTPTLTDYDKRVPYNAYDVTDRLKKGANAIGVILGNGRFFGMRDFHGNPNPMTGSRQVTYGFPRLLLQIRVEYRDGSVEYIHSDGSWKVTDQGPIRANNEYDGEEYDARMEFAGWDTPGFDDRTWKAVDLMDAPKGVLYSQPNENIKIKETLIPKEVYATSRGTYMVDMGQNMVGWLKINLKGNAGDTVKLVFAERMKNRDTLYTENLRYARATDTYVMKGEGTEQWHPIFTYHGFRYVEVFGLSTPPTVADFEGQVVYDDVQTIGDFTSSNETLNQIFKNAYWTIRSNYRGIPTDCPQRDERVAWLGDRIMSSYGESFIFDNSRLYAKWMDDIQVAQNENGSLPDVVPAYWIVHNDNVTYPSAYIIIPEMLRKQFADEATYRKHYPGMKKWMDYMWDTYSTDDLVLKDVYGDWCVAPEEGTDVIWTNDPKRTTDGGLVAASYYYYCLTLMKNFASLQGMDEDAAYFDTRAQRVRSAFNKRFFHSDSLYYGNNTTTANLLPLTFGMVETENRDAVFNRILEKTAEYGNHIHTGIMGAMWYMRGLSDHGRPDLAYTVATQKTYPSWGYMIENGATTIWELWNGNTGHPLMNSWNHQMLLGDLLIWYYEYLAGIKSDPGQTGFKGVVMHPIFPEGLEYVNASYQSIYGMIKSHWRKENQTLRWQITIPPNATARVSLPANTEKAIKEGGVSLGEVSEIRLLDKDDRQVWVEIGSGDYDFVVADVKWGE